MAAAPLAVVDQHTLLVVVDLLDGGWVPGKTEAISQTEESFRHLHCRGYSPSVSDQVLWRSLASS